MLDGPALELHPRLAPNVVTTLGRLAGRTVGVIANNPLRLGGCLDSASAEKAARFVRMCDAFGVPLVVLVDVPGYLPGVGQEWDGVVRRGAKLLHAFAEAVVPRVTLVTRKSYGGAYIAMNARSLGATTVFAWPGAEVAVMGAKAAVGILHRKKLAAVPPGRARGAARPAGRGARADRRRRQPRPADRRRGRGRRAGADQAPARRGAGRRSRRTRRARQHPAVATVRASIPHCTPVGRTARGAARALRATSMHSAAVEPVSVSDEQKVVRTPLPRRRQDDQLSAYDRPARPVQWSWSDRDLQRSPRATGVPQTTWWSHVTGVPSPACR